jgi:putative N6-adenine-specific DNA methylase
MHALTLFLPCAAGVETFLATEVARITGLPEAGLRTSRGGVQADADWRSALKLNLHCRLAQRVLVRLADLPYRNEDDIYARRRAWHGKSGSRRNRASRWRSPRSTAR